MQTILRKQARKSFNHKECLKLSLEDTKLDNRQTSYVIDDNKKMVNVQTEIV